MKNRGSITIPISQLSTEKETEFKIVVRNDTDYAVQDFKIPKIPPMTTMNPEETAKPTSTSSAIPTKPTPTSSVTSSGSPSGSTSPTPASSTPAASPTTSSSPVEPSKTGKTYYVSKDGSDSNSGLEESKPLKKIQTGIDKLKAGDKLIIKAGTYKEKLSIKKSGSKEKPITIVASGSVKVDGNKKGGILLKVNSGAKYITINNIAFQNLHGQEARGISLASNTKHITIEKCSFTNISCPNPSSESSTANAIYFEGSGKSESSAIEQITIKNCKLSKICPGWSEGISVDGNCKNITIDGVTATADGVETNIAICICGNDKETNSANSVNRPRGVTVKNCNVSGCKSPYDQDSYGIYVDGAYDVTIENNTVSNSEGGIEVGSEKKNSSFSNKETQKVTVKGNSINNCACGLYIGGDKEESRSGYVYNVTVTGNTLKNCGIKGKTEVVTFDRCNKVTFSNNTLTATNKARMIYVRDSAKSLTFKKNSYSNGRKASDDYSFGKENSDYSFSKWVSKFGDTDSTFK